jgi:hypothetical protein
MSFPAQVQRSPSYQAPRYHQKPAAKDASPSSKGGGVGSYMWHKQPAPGSLSALELV